MMSPENMGIEFCFFCLYDGSKKSRHQHSDKWITLTSRSPTCTKLQVVSGEQRRGDETHKTL